MISDPLIIGIAYGITFLLTYSIANKIVLWFTLNGSSYWKATIGFFLALTLGWLAGSIFSALLYTLLSSVMQNSTSKDALLLPLVGKCFWFSVFGAGSGIYRTSGLNSPKFGATHPPRLNFKKFIWISSAIAVIGIVAAVALPAYQDYTKRNVLSMKRTESTPTSSAESTIDWDKGVITPPKELPTETSEKFWANDKPAGEVITQPNLATQLDKNTARPVNDAKNRSFTYEEAISPKTQSAEYQEHYRRIYAAHPDADAIHASPAFQAWLTKYPAYKRIVAGGTTEEIIEMFGTYKSNSSDDAATQEHYRRIYAAHADTDGILKSPDFQAWVAKYPAYQRILKQGTTQEIIEMFTAYKNQR